MGNVTSCANSAVAGRRWHRWTDRTPTWGEHVAKRIQGLHCDTTSAAHNERQLEKNYGEVANAEKWSATGLA